MSPKSQLLKDILSLPESQQGLVELRDKFSNAITKQMFEKHPNHAPYEHKMHGLALGNCPFAKLQTSCWARMLPGCTFLGDALSEKVRFQFD